MMTVPCDHEQFCTKSLVVPSGELLTDAARTCHWKHIRLPGGKTKNYCPEHKPQ